VEYSMFPDEESRYPRHLGAAIEVALARKSSVPGCSLFDVIKDRNSSFSLFQLHPFDHRRKFT
jgi:hypothetical protein